MRTRPRILIADDQADVLQALRLLLKPEGWEVETASSPAQILERVEAQDFDVVLMDLNYSRATTSGAEGLELLARIAELDATLPVVVMTAWGSVETAVEAMRRGARDFVAKPWDNHRLRATLDNQLSLVRALRQNQVLSARERLSQQRREDAEMIASSPAMTPVLELIDRVGPSDANVLVTGEHGTGKELVARRIHAVSAASGRAGELVTINAGGLADGVFESELFGHVKGAFTDAKAARIGCFELADGGTLFLDEIGNMPPGQQAKLLRVLQTGELRRVGSSKVRRVDVRLVTATNVDLHAAVDAGGFREDLLYRINTVEIHLPALRERREDIPRLAERFMRRRARHYGRTLAGFSEAAMDALVDHRWPGNVRELEHVVERAVLMAKVEVIEARDLGLRGGLAEARAGADASGWEALDPLTLEDAEKVLIQRALDRCEGNASLAAAELGLSRSAFYRRLQRHGLSST